MIYYRESGYVTLLKRMQGLLWPAVEILADAYDSIEVGFYSLTLSIVLGCGPSFRTWSLLLRHFPSEGFH